MTNIVSSAEDDSPCKTKNHFFRDFIGSLTLEQISILVQIEDNKLGKRFDNINFSNEPLLKEFFICLAPFQVSTLKESRIVDEYSLSRHCMNIIMTELFFFRNSPII